MARNRLNFALDPSVSSSSSPSTSSSSWTCKCTYVNSLDSVFCLVCSEPMTQSNDFTHKSRPTINSPLSNAVGTIALLEGFQHVLTPLTVPKTEVKISPATQQIKQEIENNKKQIEMPYNITDSKNNKKHIRATSILLSSGAKLLSESKYSQLISLVFPAKNTQSPVNHRETFEGYHNQGFNFNTIDTTSKLRESYSKKELELYELGLIEHANAPSALLSVVQAEILKFALFPNSIPTELQSILEDDEDNDEEIKENSKMNTNSTNAPSKFDRNILLVQALTSILWRCRPNMESAVNLIVLRDESKESSFTPRSKPKTDNSLQFSSLLTAFLTYGVNEQQKPQYSDAISLITITTEVQLFTFIQMYLPHFQAKGGLLLFLFSIVYTYGLDQFKFHSLNDTADSTNNNNTNNSDSKQLYSIIVPISNVLRQEFITLVLTGEYTPNIHNNEEKYNILLGRGISKKSETGLIINNDLRPLIGTYLLWPKYPVWLLCHESHYTVLFSYDPSLLNSELFILSAENRSVLYCYNGSDSFTYLDKNNNKHCGPQLSQLALQTEIWTNLPRLSNPIDNYIAKAESGNINTDDADWICTDCNTTNSFIISICISCLHRNPSSPPLFATYDLDETLEIFDFQLKDNQYYFKCQAKDAQTTWDCKQCKTVNTISNFLCTSCSQPFEPIIGKWSCLVCSYTHTETQLLPTMFCSMCSSANSVFENETNRSSKTEYCYVCTRCNYSNDRIQSPNRCIRCGCCKLKPNAEILWLNYSELETEGLQRNAYKTLAPLIHCIHTIHENSIILWSEPGYPHI